MRLVVAAAIVACLAAPAFASPGNGLQTHPLERFLQVRLSHASVWAFSHKLSSLLNMHCLE